MDRRPLRDLFPDAIRNLLLSEVGRFTREMCGLAQAICLSRVELRHCPMPLRHVWAHLSAQGSAVRR
jgi:hypothetical protein